ncbi:MAG: DUF2911 domain-containing protein [Flavisolibacter sp.]
MKRLILSLNFLLMVLLSMAQTSSALVNSNNPKLPALDQSPMDMAYFPADYPILKTQNKVSTPPVARIIYGRPQKNDREVFGELVAYDKVWRLGANEATEIEFFKDVTIEGKKIAKGRYTLYAIPTETKWTLIINKDTDTWGAFVYDASKDVLRTEVAITKLDVPVELFSMVFNASTRGANLVIAWESVGVTLPIEFK